MRKVTLRRIITVANAASRGFPAVLLTGPRRSGKTTLLQLMRPKADYRLLEDPDSLAQVQASGTSCTPPPPRRACCLARRWSVS
jgi:hypothetical protein